LNSTANTVIGRGSVNNLNAVKIKRAAFREDTGPPAFVYIDLK